MDLLISQILIALAFAIFGAGSGYGATKLAQLLLRRRSLDDYFPTRVIVIIPIILAIAFASGYIYFGLSVEFAYLMCMAALTAIISLTDVKHRIIPNQLVIAIFALTIGFVFIGGMAFDWLSSLWGMLLCLAIFIIPALKGGGMGMGDVKLAAAIGFAAGLMGSLFTIVCMGLLIILAALFRYHPKVDYLKSMIPLGPFIMTAFMVIQVIY